MSIKWSHLGLPLCLFNRHSPVKGHAKWDGKYYVGKCRHCDAAIFRKDKGVWKKAAARTV